MNETRCPECGWPNSPNTAHCYCGYPLFKDSNACQADVALLPIYAAESCQADTSEVLLLSTLNTQPKSSHYFVRHWRGELPLPVAYWVNTILPSWLIGFVIEASSSSSYYSASFVRSPKVFCAAIILFWLAIYGASAWQLVGVWRSSGRRLNAVPRHPGRGWAFIAMAAVCVGWLYLLVISITAAGPQVWELGQLLIGYDKFGPYNVRVLHHGTELEIAGALSIGVSDEVERQLLTHPNVQVVHLNSIGGRIGEGHRLRDIIGERHLVTYSSKGCQSACTLAFLAGRERYLRRGVKLGFHRGHFPGVEDIDADSWVDEDRKNWKALGIPTTFTNRALSTPNKDMWMPEEEELLAAHVVTALTRGEHFTPTYLTFENTPIKDIEDRLAGNAFYRALKERDNASYQSLILLQRDFSVGEATEAEIFEANKHIAANAMNRYLPSAGDQETINLVNSVIELTRYIAQSSTEACYAYLFAGTTAGITIPDKFEKQIMVTLAEVIKSARNEKPVMSSQEAELPLSQLMATLSSRFPNDIEVLNEMDNPNVDRGKACRMTLAMYDEALKMPPSQAGPLLRYLFSSTAQR